MAAAVWVITLCLASPTVNFDLSALPRQGQVYSPDARRGHVLSMESIRIALFMDDLTCTGPEGRCKCTQVGQQVADFQGTIFSCKEEDILTTAKAAYLRTILTEAIIFLQEAIRVHRVVGPLRGGAGVCGIPSSDTSSISGVNLPKDHYKPGPGVPNADFIVYSTAAPSEGQTQAWALSCQLDDDERPIMAMINFVPGLLPTVPQDVSHAEYTNSVNTAIHELFHALGYSLQFFNSTRWFPKYPIRAEGTKYFFSSPKVLEKARKHFACPDLTGVELENQGGAGTKLSHWEKRIFGNEAMTGAQADDVSVISEITLAYFEDTGYYSVNYSKAGVLKFGKDSGCAFVSSKCNVIPSQDEFCFPNPDDPYVEQCAASLMAHGPCMITMYDSPIDKQYRYFTDPKRGGHIVFSDYCPFYSAQTQCTTLDDHDVTCPQRVTEAACSQDSLCVWGKSCVSVKHHVQGESFGDSSRCFTSNIVAKGWEIPSSSRCFIVTCAADGNSYSIRIGSYNVYCGVNTTTAVTPEGFIADWKGTVNCHPQAYICDKTVQVGDVPSPAPVPDTPPPTEGKEINWSSALPAIGAAIGVFLVIVLLLRWRGSKGVPAAHKPTMNRKENTFVMPPATMQTAQQELSLAEVTGIRPLQSPLLRGECGPETLAT